MRKILATLAVPAGVGAIVLMSAGAGFASNGPVTAVTHSAQHPDTTNVAVQGRTDNVWALDNMSEHFTVVPVSNQADGTNYQVTIDVTGSFQGFADPMTGAALISSGPVHGTIEYDVQSGTAPNPKSLPAQEPDSAGLGVALNQLFGVTNGSSIFSNAPGSPLVVGGGAYSFSYQNGNYTQTYNPSRGDNGTITGDVTGH
jgi:hypothetical protein